MSVNDDKSTSGAGSEPGAVALDDAPLVGPARPDAFVSYRRLPADMAFVDQLQEALAERGKHIWVDRTAIEPAADWWERVKRGIESSKALIFVITPDSVVSEESGRELEIAGGIPQACHSGGF